MSEPADCQATLHVREIHGDLLSLDGVDAIVNPWNRNFVPRGHSRLRESVDK